MTKRQDRVRAYRRGVFAETLVALLFRLKGHRIVARRYETPVGEIDLVALKGRRLAFIEVKRRRTRDDAAWTVTAKQRRRIVRAAQYWLASHPGFAGHDIAFDVVLAAPWSWPRVIANAFRFSDHHAAPKQRSRRSVATTPALPPAFAEAKLLRLRAGRLGESTRATWRAVRGKRRSAVIGNPLTRLAARR